MIASTSPQTIIRWQTPARTHVTPDGSHHIAGHVQGSATSPVMAAAPAAIDVPVSDRSALRSHLIVGPNVSGGLIMGWGPRF